MNNRNKEASEVLSLKRRMIWHLDLNTAGRNSSHYCCVRALSLSCRIKTNRSLSVRSGSTAPLAQSNLIKIKKLKVHNIKSSSRKSVSVINPPPPRPPAVTPSCENRPITRAGSRQVMVMLHSTYHYRCCTGFQQKDSHASSTQIRVLRQWR